MLPRSKRLSKKEFDEVMKKGRVNHSTFFTVIWVVSEDKHLKISSVAPKKIAKTAVLRNAIRRKVYSAVGKSINDISLPIKAIFLSKTGVIDIKNQDLKKEVRSIFVKMKVLK